jgi:glycosyltransferase involved in cell wall biosynthesis
MSKPLCLVTAPVATRSGYGAHSRDICRALIKLDRYDVKIWPVRWGNTPMNALHIDDSNDKIIIDRLLPSPELPNQPEIHIHVVIPNEFSPVAKYNIGIDIQDEQTKQIKGVLKNEKPIEVLFEGVDTSIYKKTREFSKSLVDEMNKINETFNFLYVGHWLQGGLGKDRKDTGMLVKVFCETFKNMKRKPGLIMKTSGAGFSVLDRESLLKKIKDVKDTVRGDLPNVYLLHGDFLDEEINELYNHPKVKAHISLTHGEGFGRPLLEATISEKPVIASDWSGHTDFLKKPNAVLIGGSLQNIEKGSFPDDFFIEGSQWFTVNYQEASVVMKNMYKGYRKYTLGAKKLATYNRAKFSLDEMTIQLGKILDKHVPEFPQEVKLQLPKLKKVGSTELSKIKLPKLKKV